MNSNIDSFTSPFLTFNNGNKYPQLGFGTYYIDDQKAFESAYNIGYRLFDTAPMYGNESDLGNFFSKLNPKPKREDFYITTKIGPDMQGKDKAYKSCEESLKNLKVDYIDLVVIHWPGIYGKGKAKEIRAGTWEGLEKLYFEGKIKNIGVSNYYTNHLKDLLSRCKIKPVLNQIEIHPLLFPLDTINYCKENNIVVQAYCSMAQQDSKLVNNKIILKMAKKYKKSVSQICLKWALQHGIAILPRSKNKDRIKENCQLFDFEIESNDMEEINSLNCNYHVDWDPTNIE